MGGGDDDENDDERDPFGIPSGFARLASPEWRRTAVPDPDEGDIHNVQYGGAGEARGPGAQGGPGRMRISSTTTYFGGRGANGQYSTQHQTRVMNAGDVFPQLLGNLLGYTHPQGPQGQQQQSSTPRSPLQEGPFRMGGSPRMQSSIRITTGGIGPGGRFTHTHDVATDDIMGIFGSLMQGIGGAHGGFGNTPAANDGQASAAHPLNLFAQILNPANARSGDAVFTNEALDRVISQLMEQHSGSSAPGPASESAISALPKIQISKEHLGENGVAECSICMDSVEIGTQVTELPCKHWFHEDCVAVWLREHDTCPQCRRGITPKEGDADRPRATGQAPRFWQMSEGDFRPDGSGRTPSQPASPLGNPGSPQHQEQRRESAAPRPDASHRHASGGPGRRDDAPERQSSSTAAGAWSSLMERIRGSSSSSAAGAREHHHQPRRRSSGSGNGRANNNGSNSSAENRSDSHYSPSSSQSQWQRRHHHFHKRQFPDGGSGLD